MLTLKQARFVDEYLIDLNATQAAVRTGYSAKTARQQGTRLLSYAAIQAALSARQRTIAEKSGVTVENIVAELAKLGFANMADYMRANPDGDPYLNFSALTRDQAAALQEVTVEDYTEGRGKETRNVKRIKFKLADKGHNLERLARHLGMFVEKHEHEAGDALLEMITMSMKSKAG